MDGKKFIREHPGTMALTLLAGILYVGFAKDLGEVNPVKILNKYEARHQEETKRKKLYNDIFGKGGYADRNGDNAIDFSEQVDAYRRMGYQNEVFIEGRWGTFPYPKLSQLESAIKSYEAERNQKLKQ